MYVCMYVYIYIYIYNRDFRGASASHLLRRGTLPVVRGAAKKGAPSLPVLRSVFIFSSRKITNRASQILKENPLLMCPYCLKFQIARV